MTLPRKKDRWDPSSRYACVNRLILAARANGDHYEADETTLEAEIKAVKEVDKYIKRSRKNDASAR